MLFRLHLGLQGMTEVDTDPKGRFVSFKATHSNDRVLFVPLRGKAPENRWLGGRFFEGLQTYMQNENDGNENKIIFGDLNCTMDKIEMMKIKHKDFIGAVPITPCENSSLIMCLRIYGEGRTQILLSSPATIGPLPRIQHRQGLY